MSVQQVPNTTSSQSVPSPEVTDNTSVATKIFMVMTLR